MKPETCAALLELNRRFYAKFAGDFARTRRSWPPGFGRILPHLRPAANVADLGCGNGRLLAFLAGSGWSGRYLGVDSSEALLALTAAEAAKHPRITAQFICAELSSCDGDISRSFANELGRSRWEAVTALAVLHHIPGAVNRARLFAACAELLRPGGALVVSTWQFLSTTRLGERILAWEAVGIRPEDVEPDDYLLPWGENAAGQRYCAAIGEEDLRRLAEGAGLTCDEVFYSDGHEGHLNLYGIFRRAAIP